MNHPTAWNLIPWFVNGRAPEREREALEVHLAGCADCRAEIEAQRVLMNAMRTTPVVESMPHASLQKLWQRMDAHPLQASPAPVRVRQTRLVGWLAAAVAVQALLLGTLSTVVYDSRQQVTAPGEFRTVTSAAATPAVPGVRAVFSPALTLGELQSLLADARLKIAGGPSEDGVYTLATLSPADDTRQALRILRAHPASRFAEPIGP